MPEVQFTVDMDRPRPYSAEPGEFRFMLRRVKADYPEFDRLGYDGREVGVGIEWWTRQEHRFIAVNTAARLVVRHLKAVGIISQVCEPILLESRFRHLGDQAPHLLVTIRYGGK